ncbi:hypothetical protein [Enterococcus sp. 5H]|uniref:hypothetical protein n=1 Tax=Enterococcus sp. 5H TaxID=1229490 RepID=UPI002303B450|nr:hypothetical protein [Enterococcus sp. 5H]MDA9472419.1 Enoyl-, acyl-carrier-protein reductase, FMN [Enterococcus sp. 5H]
MNAEKEDVTIIKSPVEIPRRAIKTQFSESIKHEQIPVEKCRNCLSYNYWDRETIPYCITETFLNSVTKDAEHPLVFASSNVYRIKEKTSVKAIFDELTMA